MLDWSERDAAQMGITLAILGAVFMSNGKVRLCHEISPVFCAIKNIFLKLPVRFMVKRSFLEV